MGTVFLREKRYFALAILVILALGASALATIGRQEDPTIANQFGTITTPFPGAAPERVEALVTEKIEDELAEIAEIKQVESTSTTGISIIRVDLADTLTDAELEQAWSEIRDALADAAVTFPAGVPEPELDTDKGYAYTAILSLTATEGRDVPLAVIARHAEMLQDRLRGLSGTRLVNLYGEPEEEVRVTLDRARTADLGITAGEVAAALEAADAKVNSGRAAGGASDFLIEVAGEFETLERIREVPLRAADGRAVRVGDIATVSRAVADPPSALAMHDGSPAVVIAARMQPDLQVDAWMAQVRAAVDGFAESLPGGLTLEWVFDQSAYTADRLSGLGENIAMGIGLVVAVLFLTLGWRAALVVALVLPMTSLLSLAILQKLGIPIHQMSVTGLIVALGLLVDAAIVMTDEIRKRLLAGLSVAPAVGDAVRRLAIPLLASTVTTVLAFVPMATLPGPAGDFVGAIAMSVIVMLVVSLGLALTITPALAGFLLPGGIGARGVLGTGIHGGALGRAFAWTIRASLRNRAVAVAAALALPVAGFMAFPTLTAQFFPGVDRDQLHIQIDLGDGASIARTRDAVARIDAVLAGEADIARVDWFLGESAASFYYNMQPDRQRAPGFAEALVTTAGAEATEQLIPHLQAALDAAAPGAQVLVRGLVQGPPVSAPLEMRLVGPDLAVLRQLGDEARRLIAAEPAVLHTRADLMGGAPKYVFAFDEDALRLAGLTLGDAAAQLSALTDGVTGGSILEGTEQVPVRVVLEETARLSPEGLRGLTLTAPDGSAVPVTALGRLELRPSDSPVARLNGERVNNVQAFLERGVLPEEILAGVKAQLEETPLALPPGYRIEWGGDSEERGETINNLISTLGLVVAATIATIVLTFNSWRLSAVAFTVMGLSMGLSLLALAIFQYPFGITALIGVIGSIGVSINAAIIIMTAMQEDPEARFGDRDAMERVVTGSARHIVSTTITTFGGFLPLILEGGGFWPPFAMAIAGGVLLSTVVSFYFVPPVYSLVCRRRSREAVEEDVLVLTSPVPVPLRPALAAE